MALYVLSSTYRNPARCVIRLGAARREITDDPSRIVLKKAIFKSSRNRAVSAKLELAVRSVEEGYIPNKDEVFASGQAVTVEMNFGNYAEPLMEGVVRHVTAEPGAETGYTNITLRCQDPLVWLDQEPRHRIWGGDKSVDDRFITAVILEKYGLQLHPGSGTGQRCPLLHQNDTDLNFLRQRAEVNSYDLLFKDGMVYFGPMRLETPSQNIIQVHSSLESPCRHLSVLSDGPWLDDAFLYRAEGELDGSYYGHVLRVGEPVGVEGVGERYDGVYYVDTVHHRYTIDSYRQIFTLLRITSDDELDGIQVGPMPQTPGILYDAL